MGAHISPHNSDKGRATRVETLVGVAVQIVSQNVKSDRLIKYHKRNPDSPFYTRLVTSLTHFQPMFHLWINQVVGFYKQNV